VDPQANDIDSYIEFAKAKGMEIKYVIDTHVQADHVSGGRRLAQLTGADYCLHGAADVTFNFTQLTDDQHMISATCRSMYFIHPDTRRKASVF
jgi:hydroxyacylglutathione hydrolase